MKDTDRITDRQPKVTPGHAALIRFLDRDDISPKLRAQVVKQVAILETWRAKIRTLRTRERIRRFRQRQAQKQSNFGI